MNSIQKIDELNLEIIISIIREYRLIIVFIMTSSILLSISYLLIAQPIYRAEIVITSQDSEVNDFSEYSGIAALAGISIPSSGNNTDIALAVLKSRRFLEPFIRSEKLDLILTSDIEASSEELYVIFKEEVLGIMKDSVTGIITVSIDLPDASLSAKIANRIISKLNSDLREGAMEETQTNIVFLKEQISTTSVNEVKAAIFSVIEEQTKKLMFTNTREDYVFKIIDPATIPERTHSPRTSTVLFIGLFIGFSLSLLLIFVDIIFQLQKLNRFKKSNLV